MIQKRPTWQLFALIFAWTTFSPVLSEHHTAIAVVPSSNLLKTPANATYVPRKKKKRKTKGTATAKKSPILQVQTTTTQKTIKNGQQTTTIISSTRRIKKVDSRESASLRRIQREWRDAARLGIAYDWVNSKSIGKPASSTFQYVRIGPFGRNLLRWHFSVSGPPSSDFSHGIYHGRVLLPKDYPGSPPRIQVLTPSGRFIPGHDICLSASNFHPESWTPRWTVLSLVDALRLHMLTQANEIGGMNATPQERRAMAKASRKWTLGRVRHETMVDDGVFPLEDGEDSIKIEESTSFVSAVAAAVRHTPEAPAAQQPLPRQAGLAGQLLRAIVEVLSSPPRLVAIILLTVFILLNK
jgi:ubiquitin-protein ligase